MISALIPSVSAILSVSAFLALAPSPVSGDEFLDRSHGAVMGDGLRLTSQPDPAHGGGVCADGETVFGIDVSYYQGDIDWNAVAADGVEYAIVRVSHSTQFFDPQFNTNLAGSRAAGLHTGVYQYFEPDEDPIAQANLLLDSMGPLLPGDLPPVIDVESTGGQSPAAVASAVRAWVDHVEAALGVAPIIYTGHYFWQDNVASVEFGGYPLWVAWYGVECPGAVPTGWSQWAFHQYCDCGSIAGIAGPVDVNRFNGSLADLAAMGATPECGDDVCSGAENPATCPEDCEPCGVVSSAGGTLDNGDACYALYGNAEYWREEAQGEGGTLVWTNATSNADPSNYARWELYFEASGLYELQVHVVQPFGESAMAAYQISHAGGEDTVVIDQSANDGWVSLGAFDFDAGAAHSVVLGDNTGEPVEGEVSIVYDAVQLVRLDGDDSTTSGGEEGSDVGGDDSTGSPTDESSGTTDAPTGSTGQGSGPALPPEDGDTSGCGCRSQQGGTGAWLLVLLGGLFVRRRRAATRA